VWVHRVRPWSVLDEPEDGGEVRAANPRGVPRCAGTLVDFRVSHRRVAFMTQPILQKGASLSAASVVAEPDPDRDLVARWQAGDASAFDVLVRRHQRRVFGLLMRMLGSAQEAEDVAQETFLNLHRHGRRFRSEARFSTFVYRVAVNAALNRRRSLGRRRARMEALEARQAAGDDLPGSPRSPEDSALGGEAREYVQAAILELPPKLRAPLVLYDIEGMPYAEVAGVLELAEGTVKSRIHRARQALREALRDYWERAQAPDAAEEESA
jgi:RNA polymerase sigma-70 factor (ECF subfamily)